VSWCDFEQICGAGNACEPEHPSWIILTRRAIERGDQSLPDCGKCGCKGGPGYRDGKGRCIGWDNLAEICGSPPTLKCKAEMSGQTASEVARAQAAYAEHLDNCRNSP
jgi:hypothetical protein